MIEIRPQVTIDLKEYGGNGIMIMEPRTPRKMREFKNMISVACMEISSKTGAVVSLTGDMELYSLLSFVTSAPFLGKKGNELEDFTDFLDSIDEKGWGNADRLMSRMAREMQGLKYKEQAGGETGPLVRSGITEE